MTRDEIFAFVDEVRANPKAVIEWIFIDPITPWGIAAEGQPWNFAFCRYRVKPPVAEPMTLAEIDEFVAILSNPLSKVRRCRIGESEWSEHLFGSRFEFSKYRYEADLYKVLR